jgi:adenosylhomocysteine/aminodeoxyfutalosine nucleosidase
MKLAIMGAMPEEIAPILERVGDYKVINRAGNRYYECTFGGHELVIAYSKIGKVFSALTAATMIEHFGAEKLLFSGVAGAISSDLGVGDLIIATRLCQHDLDITAFGHPHGFVPEGAQFIDTDDRLKQVAIEVAESMGIVLKEGVIATGDQFVADPERKTFIEQTFNADALEMEGASVAVVCDAHAIPFFILRAISDAADMDASFDFDTFLESSAKISADFIMKMVEQIA